MRIHPLAIALVSLCLTGAPSLGFAHGPGAVYEGDLSPQNRRQLAALRAATAVYHDFDLATQTGLWDTPITGCLVDEEDGTGGMGYHLANIPYLFDGVLNPTRPEVLIYEPEKDGSMRLVAVEFLLPGLAGDTAPTLLGQTFHYVPAFGVWALHVWVWRHNPNPEGGMFADWNPNVSCRYAP